MDRISGANRVYAASLEARRFYFFLANFLWHPYDFRRPTQEAESLIASKRGLGGVHLPQQSLDHLCKKSDRFARRSGANRQWSNSVK